MGTLTLEEFRDEVRLICTGLDPDDSTWTNARIDRRINASYLWVSMPNHYRHPELATMESITLVANDATYALTNTYYEIIGVAHAQDAAGSVTDETRRRKLAPDDIRTHMDIMRNPSQPTTYAWHQDEVWINCVPNTASQGQVLEVYGYQQPNTLSAITDVTLLKPEWDEVIVVGAEWRMWISMNENDRAYEAKQNYAQLVNEIADWSKMHANEWGWQTADSGQGMIMRSD